jgi:hypothetical protein
MRLNAEVPALEIYEGFRNTLIDKTTERTSRPELRETIKEGSFSSLTINSGLPVAARDFERLSSTECAQRRTS